MSAKQTQNKNQTQTKPVAKPAGKKTASDSVKVDATTPPKKVEKVVVKKDAAKQTGKKPVAKKGKDSKKNTKKAKVVKAPKNPGERGDRSFKVIYTAPDGKVVMDGRYCGAKPKQAACKALTGIYKTYKEANTTVTEPIQFGVHETTRGSKNKRYWYSGGKTGLKNAINLYKLPSAPGDKKQYCSADKIERNHGGFLTLYGKPQYEKDIPDDKDARVELEKTYVLPSITYKFANNVKKIKPELCTHLHNVQRIVNDDDTATKVAAATVVAPAATPVPKQKKGKTASPPDTTTTPAPVATPDTTSKKQPKGKKTVVA